MKVLWMLQLGFWVKGLTAQGKEALNEHFQVEEGSTEDKILDFAGTLLQGLTGVGTKLGSTEIKKLCPSNNNGGGNNNNGGTNNNNGGENNNNGGENNNNPKNLASTANT